jgi:ABC-2 type transport system ATP-binding protein
MTEGGGAPAAIETEALTKIFGPVRALDGIDLRVEPGEVFGFLGPNGAGKSTAIRILLDLIRPTSGAARVFGFDTQRESVDAHRCIGFLPDDVQLYNDLTAAQYFDYVQHLRGDVDAAQRDRLADDLQLDVHRRVGTLSRGNRQKVGLVQALMTRPRVVILDEPTSGLDPLMQEVIEETLREVAADGRTVFFSSHVLAEVEEVCTRVAILREGRIVDVFELAEQRRLLPRRVTVTFAGEAPPNGTFEGLPQVRQREHDGRRIVFETSGSVDPLIKALAAHNVEAIASHEATLEDLFLSYYGDRRHPHDDDSRVNTASAIDEASDGAGGE